MLAMCAKEMLSEIAHLEIRVLSSRVSGQNQRRLDLPLLIELKGCAHSYLVAELALPIAKVGLSAIIARSIIMRVSISEYSRRRTDR
jgi:hypothetical protein